MQEGYTESMKKKPIAACDIWIELWERIKGIMAEYNIPYIELMDKAFSGQQSIYNWSMDFENELYQSSIKNKKYLEVRIEICREYISMSKKQDDLNNLVRRRVIAESYFLLGNVNKGERLFKEYVNNYPKDGWGWINWSDQYGLFLNDESRRDYKKAVTILETGLDVPDLEDREEVLQRLVELYIKLDLTQKANDAKRKIEKLKKENEKKYMEARLVFNEKKHTEANQVFRGSQKNYQVDKSIRQNKVGRNDPCPCGSGKKYKKCCGR